MPLPSVRAAAWQEREAKEKKKKQKKRERKAAREKGPKEEL